MVCSTSTSSTWTEVVAVPLVPCIDVKSCAPLCNVPFIDGDEDTQDENDSCRGCDDDLVEQ